QPWQRPAGPTRATDADGARAPSAGPWRAGARGTPTATATPPGRSDTCGRARPGEGPRHDPPRGRVRRAAGNVRPARGAAPGAMRAAPTPVLSRLPPPAREAPPPQVEGPPRQPPPLGQAEPRTRQPPPDPSRHPAPVARD